MQSYRVTFIFQGNRYTQMFQASSSDAARRLVTGQFPGCSVWDVAKL